jgi:hypothetical protein
MRFDTLDSGERKMNKTRIPTAVIALLAIGSFDRQATAQFINGGLEDSAGPAGWQLTQSVTGLPGEPVSASEHVAFADVGYDHDMPEPGVNEGLLGLYVKPFAGNQGRYQDQGLPTNVFLRQTYNNAVVGRTYTFTGHSYYQLSYSGNSDTLNENNVVGDYNGDFAVNAADYVVWRDNLDTSFQLPNEDPAVTPGMVTQEDYDVWISRFGHAGHGATTSPTETYFEIAFLNANDEVLGTPTRLDLPEDRTEDLFPTDPPNVPIPYQMHSVTSATPAPAGTTKVRVTVAATNMLSNCCTTVNDIQRGQDVYFDQFSLLDSSVPIQRLTNANLNTLGAPAGWTVEKTPEDNIQFSNADYAIHTGGTGMWLRSFAGGDAKILQTVAATAGGNYTFSAWSKWETGHSGASPVCVPATECTQPTETFIRMEFLDSSNAVIDTENLNLISVQIPDGEWREFSVNGVAPVGTTNVRVSAGSSFMYNTLIDPQSAMFDDFALTLAGSGGGNLLLAAVPEPASCSLILIALVAAAVLRRRRETS